MQTTLSEITKHYNTATTKCSPVSSSSGSAIAGCSVESAAGFGGMLDWLNRRAKDSTAESVLWNVNICSC